MGYVVDGKVRIFAWADPAVEDLSGYEPAPKLAATVSQVSPEYFIVKYESRDDLLDQCEGILNGLKNSPCLEILEIVAHGWPLSVDGLTGTDVLLGRWSRLANLRWCEVCEIYLSGCNTGNRIPSLADLPSVAETLAAAIPPKPKAFRCTVYGSVGYQRGSHAGKDTQSLAEATDIWGTVTSPSYLYGRDGNYDDAPGIDNAFRGFRGPQSA